MIPCIVGLISLAIAILPESLAENSWSMNNINIYGNKPYSSVLSAGFSSFVAAVASLCGFPFK